MTNPSEAAERLRERLSLASYVMDKHSSAFDDHVNDLRTLAKAYLAEHLPDDDVRLDSEDWHEWWHSNKLNIDGEIIVSPECFIGLESVSPLSVRLFCGGGHTDLPHITTRGQLRLLLRALTPERGEPCV